MPRYYPPVGFHFRVEVLGLDGNDGDVRFSEVAGLAMELTGEDVPEGGENRFVQRYPARGKYPELVLKRGLLLSSSMFTWILECLQDHKITPHDIDVTLLNEEHTP